MYATTLSASRVLAHYTTGAGSQSGTPATPTSLVATAQFDTIINLSWTDNATNETGYAVERGHERHVHCARHDLARRPTRSPTRARA